MYQSESFLLLIWQDALKAAPGRIPMRPTQTANCSGSVTRTRQPLNPYSPTPAIFNGLSDYVQTSALLPSDATRPSSTICTGGGGSRTSPRPTTNVVENTAAAIGAAPVVYQVFFHQYDMSYSPAVPSNDACGTAPPSGKGAAPAS